jgi:hypothetical protein
MGQYVNFLSRLISVTLAGDRTGSAREFWFRQLEKLVRRFLGLSCSRYRYVEFYVECLRDRRELFDYIIGLASALGALTQQSGLYVVKLGDRAVCFSTEGEVAPCGPLPHSH